MLLILEQLVERPQRKQITPVAVVESSRRPICMGAVMVDIFKRQLLVNLIEGRHDYTIRLYINYTLYRYSTARMIPVLKAALARDYRIIARLDIGLSSTFWREN